MIPSPPAAKESGGEVRIPGVVDSLATVTVVYGQSRGIHSPGSIIESPGCGIESPKGGNESPGRADHPPGRGDESPGREIGIRKGGNGIRG